MRHYLLGTEAYTFLSLRIVIIFAKFLKYKKYYRINRKPSQLYNKGIDRMGSEDDVFTVSKNISLSLLYDFY